MMMFLPPQNEDGFLTDGVSTVSYFIPLTVLLVAQASNIVLDPGAIIQLVGNGITVAVLAWYVIFDVRTRTPAMLKTFREEQEAARKANEETIERVRELFISEQRLNRDTFVSEQLRTREHYDKEIAAYRSLVIDMLQGMRQAVHDVKETAQPVLNTARLALEQQTNKSGESEHASC